MDLTAEIQNFNKVKDVILDKLVSEGLLDKADSDEFSERCQVLVYKGKWFSKWFDKNVKAEDSSANSDSYYIRVIELKEKEDEIDRLLRRTTGNYDE
jgi:hypothetical protein